MKTITLFAIIGALISGCASASKKDYGTYLGEVYSTEACDLDDEQDCVEKTVYYDRTMIEYRKSGEMASIEGPYKDVRWEIQTEKDGQ